MTNVKGSGPIAWGDSIGRSVGEPGTAKRKTWMFRLEYLLNQLNNQLWLRPTLYSLLALFTPLLALAIQGLVTFDDDLKIGAAAVEDVLDILASNLLAVTTFSLGTMVAAYAAAAASVSPRASRLLLSDTTSQSALATFVGVFMFALFSIITLKTSLYTLEGRTILFGVTLLVVLWTIMVLVRWIDYLARFGRVGTTTDRVEEAATAAIRTWRERPALGGVPRDPATPVPDGFMPVKADQIGYVTTIDIEALNEIACDHDTTIHVSALPGAFVHAGNPIAFVPPDIPDAARARISDAFVVKRTRSFDQDPRFGLAVLAEIASRALSPALNDMGTAIEVVSRGVRTLAQLSPSEAEEAPKEPGYPHVTVPDLAVTDMFDDMFGPIARDGGANYELHIRLQKAFLALCQIDAALFAEAARKHSAYARRHAEHSLTLDEDRAHIAELCEQVAACAG